MNKHADLSNNNVFYAEVIELQYVNVLNFVA